MSSEVEITTAPDKAEEAIGLEGSSDDELNNLSLRQVAPVDIAIDGLTVDIDLKPSLLDIFMSPKASRGPNRPRTKRILNNVSGSMPAGSLTAILGASGSGKTSLLNVMSHRMKDSRLKRSGACLFNGNPELSSIRSAYVMQTDMLLPTLTVRETLTYSAELRLPSSTPKAELKKIVEEVILELGLKECADTRIGDDEHKGCSGGEKRRTSLGVQLLANPSVLFLDEVTTGLDAASAFQLVRTLKQLAQKGRTIVTTIHQPRSEIWGLFDRLILLSGGNTLYSGPSAACLTHFEALGHETLPFVNPAEHLIDLAAIDIRSTDLEEVSKARVDRLVAAWKDRLLDSMDDKNEKPAASKDEATGSGTQGDIEVVERKTSLYRQVRVQTARTLKTTVRDPMGLAGSFVESVGLSVLTGWIFSNLGEDLSGIRSREGAIYNASALQSYLVLLFEIYRLSMDIGVFDRERAEGVVSPLSFILGRRFARLFIEDLPMPLLFSTIYYFFCGFRHDAAQFFIFFGVLLIQQFIAVTFAMVCIALARDFATASLYANLNFTVQSMCSGFFVQSQQIPVYVRWLKYTAYVWYANGALINNEFVAHTSNPVGQLYDCPYPGGASNPACQQYTGKFVVDSFGIPSDEWIWRPVVVLVAFAVGFFLISWIILWLNKVDMRISRQQSSTIDQSMGKEDLGAHSRREARTIDITLSDYSLTIRKHSPLFWRHANVVPIVRPLTIRFKPGILNVIMGVSGSGKTSLLNMMANRLQNNLLTKWQVDGTMLFGGSLPSDDVIRSVVAYVCQDDDALLPTLTVRETLHFSAKLRLPPWMSTREKIQRAESVLHKLGLRDCADNLVGSELIKGISGGEKRRVSIAVQILTDPRVILLDEPTSGLDAFTASSILDVLRGLADEGRTVIFTIHQSRSDLFPYFGNILLLARNGYPVYAGAGNGMLPHFTGLGYACPQNTNPADFALDLITVDLQSAAKEARSREKVQSLIAGWDHNSSDRPTTLERGASEVSAPAELGSLRRAQTPFRKAFPLLIARSSLSFKRDPNAIAARLGQMISYGVIVTLFFAPLKSDYASVQSRFGFIQEFLAFYFVGVLCNIAVYPDARRVFYREHDDGAYGLEAFLLHYSALEIPFTAVSCLIVAVMVVFAAGLGKTAVVYFVVFFNLFCIITCGESVGIMFNTIFPRSTGFAVNVTSVVLSVSLMMSGILATSLPGFLSGVNYLSPGKYSIANLAPYTLRGVVFTCNQDQKGPDGNCPISTGEQALDLYNLNTNAGLNLLALGICTVVYRIVAYLLLKALRAHWDWRGAVRKMRGEKK